MHFDGLTFVGVAGGVYTLMADSNNEAMSTSVPRGIHPRGI
jgi:hypothetical protein